MWLGPPYSHVPRHRTPFCFEERIPADAITRYCSSAATPTPYRSSGDGNVGLLAFNADERSERYNMGDTLKAQHTHKLALGNALFRYGATPALDHRDNFGWHDTICGTTNAAMIEATYGFNDFQLARNDYYRNGRDGVPHRLGRWGLGRQDLVPNANFFSTVTVDDEGNIALSEASYQPGAWVELRADLNVLVILSTAPHPPPGEFGLPRGEIGGGRILGRRSASLRRLSHRLRREPPGLRERRGLVALRKEVQKHEHPTATGNDSRWRSLHGLASMRGSGYASWTRKAMRPWIPSSSTLRIRGNATPP